MTKIGSMVRARAAYLACGTALLWATGAALAVDTTPSTTPSSHPAPTKEQREQMAAAHEKIAACLRSDKPIDECHAEMKKMHDSMMHSHHHDMHPPPAPDSAQK